MDGRMDTPSYRDARKHLTRPDTWPPVAYAWAGAVMLKNRQKCYFNESVINLRTDRQMDRQTDRSTDERTHPLIESLVRD